MLVYSSIAHAGYILVGLTGNNDQAVGATLYYLFAYAFMNIGAFAVLQTLENNAEMDVDVSRPDRPVPTLEPRLDRRQRRHRPGRRMAHAVDGPGPHHTPRPGGGMTAGACAAAQHRGRNNGCVAWAG